jgi:2-keto-3-deoxy-L-rhamnonate aldolase
MVSATRVPPKGVFVPSPTFFLPAASSPESLQAPVDTETQINHSIFLARAGITGIGILGSTGEAVHLSRSERSDLVVAVRKGLDEAGFPDYPLMAGVLTNGELDDTLQWLDDYAKAGAQWGLVLTPGYFGPAVPQDGLVEWYKVVADRSPIPILVYNYPGVTNGVHILPETYRELARHPKIVGVKM